MILNEINITSHGNKTFRFKKMLTLLRKDIFFVSGNSFFEMNFSCFRKTELVLLRTRVVFVKNNSVLPDKQFFSKERSKNKG
jgi:hypothetical protein